MKFKEVFEKYKNGTANEEEIKFIEEEIEKNEIINDYISEDLFFEGNIELEGKNEQVRNDDEIFKNNIEKAINKKLRKILKVSILLTISIILFMNFVGESLYSIMFYNPNGKIENSYGQTEIFIDMKAFLVLHFPNSEVISVTAEDDGYGKYYIRITERDSFNSAEIERNTMTLIRGQLNEGLNFGKFMSQGIFYNEGSLSNEDIYLEERNLEEEKEFLRENLKKLPEDSFLKVYISYKEDLSMEEMIEFNNEYELYPDWVVVRGTDAYGNQSIGFNPSVSGGFIAPDTILENGNKFDDIYPYFSLHKYYSEGIDGEILENHFKDLLRYMDGREEFLDCFANVNGISSYYYKGIYDYVEENGVKTYGIQTGTDIDTVLELIEDERVINIMIGDIKYSIYERGL